MPYVCVCVCVHNTYLIQYLAMFFHLIVLYILRWDLYRKSSKDRHNLLTKKAAKCNNFITITTASKELVAHTDTHTIYHIFTCLYGQATKYCLSPLKSSNKREWIDSAATRDERRVSCVPHEIPRIYIHTTYISIQTWEYTASTRLWSTAETWPNY